MKFSIQPFLFIFFVQFRVWFAALCVRCVSAVLGCGGLKSLYCCSSCCSSWCSSWCSTWAPRLTCCFSLSPQGGEWKPGRDAGLFLLITASTTLNTLLWVLLCAAMLHHWAFWSNPTEMTHLLFVLGQGAQRNHPAGEPQHQGGRRLQEAGKIKSCLLRDCMTIWVSPAFQWSRLAWVIHPKAPWHWQWAAYSCLQPSAVWSTSHMFGRRRNPDGFRGCCLITGAVSVLFVASQRALCKKCYKQ